MFEFSQCYADDFFEAEQFVYSIRDPIILYVIAHCDIIMVPVVEVDYVVLQQSSRGYSNSHIPTDC